jgi:hypothetical protein
MGHVLLQAIAARRVCHQGRTSSIMARQFFTLHFRSRVATLVWSKGAWSPALKGDLPMTELTLENLQTELAPVRAQLDGLPFINRAVTVIQQEVRALRATFENFTLTNFTAGEIADLHVDVNRVQAENVELATKAGELGTAGP